MSFAASIHRCRHRADFWFATGMQAASFVAWVRREVRPPFHVERQGGQVFADCPQGQLDDLAWLWGEGQGR